jgi:hypothetical protein
MNRLTLFCTIVLLPICLFSAAAQPPVKADVLIYGATPAGIAAAVHAAREGVSVILAEESGHVGGLVSGGLSNTDFRTYESLGGFFREFMHRVEQHYVRMYGADSQQVIDCQKGGYYEPGVARDVLEQMMADAGHVTVLLHHRLSDVLFASNTKQLAGATFVRVDPTTVGTDADGSAQQTVIRATVLLDATYEGDLLAAAGVPYALGCEAKDTYGESLAFDEPNDWVQTYNFRATLTRDPANRLPILKPDAYDRRDYQLLAEAFATGQIKSWANPDPNPVLKVRPIPNRKADFNDDANCPVSLSLKNVNHPWPEGSPETRASIYKRYKDYSLGLFWFLGHDEAVPVAVREQMLQWGLPKDEYIDSDHWSPALYVREGRRMIGQRVFTEHDTQNPSDSARAPIRRDAVAVGDYSLNCHGVYSPAPGVNVGRIGKATRPFGVPYWVMLPKEHDGLLVPVAVSSSHVGFSALRMEPVWIGLGQAAGVAAAMAIKAGIQVRDVNVLELQLRLHQLGAMTVYVSDLAERPTRITRPAWDPPGDYEVNLVAWPPASPYFSAVQLFGTYGLFHHLIDPADSAGGGQGKATGQWRLAFADHEVRPHQPIEGSLADAWLELAEEEFGVKPSQPSLLVPDGTMTRGEFLNRLFEQITQQ